MPVGLLILFVMALLALVLLGSFGVVWYLTHPPRRTEGNAIAQGKPYDPQQAGYEYESIDVETEDRSPAGKLNLWFVPGRADDGPAVVLLHGWGDSRIGSLGWLDVLSPIVSQIVLLDIRGHGNSPFKRCTWGRYEIGDMRIAVRTLRERGCEAPVLLAGGSMGGAIAAMAAADGVECAGVMVDSPYLDSTDVTRNVVRRMGFPPWPIVDIGWWWLKKFGAKEHRIKPVEVVQQLHMPLLVMHGENDVVVPVDDARALAAAAPDGTLVTFPGSDHLMPATEHGDAYREALAAWLAAKQI